MFKQFLLVIILMTCYSGFTQSRVPNLSTVVIGALNDEQLNQLISRAQLSGLSEQEFEKRAQDAGFNSTQIIELKRRIYSSQDLLVKRTQVTNSEIIGQSRGMQEAELTNPVANPRVSRVFGSDFFSKINLTFEPNLKMATPPFYILGPGDQLILNIYGYSEVQYKLLINADGYMNIPNVSPVLVSGLSIEEVRTRLKKVLSTVYSGIGKGTTFVQILLGDIRSIRVTLIGAVEKPGMYTLPSLATIANALYVSGGVNDQGSLRKIDLIRNGKKIISFDFYDFLLRGDLSKNMLLQEGDVIKVNTYHSRVILSGAVKRPAIYELVGEEKLVQVIEYAEGYADFANKSGLLIYRYDSLGKELIMVKQDQIPVQQLKSGDSIVVGSIADYYKNRIVLTGAVFNPGDYAYEQGLHLKGLLDKARIKEDAFRSRGIIHRRRSDYSMSYLHFNIDSVITEKINIPLQKDDSVVVFTNSQTAEAKTVSIKGEVNRAGSFLYGDNMKVLDLVLMAGGFKDGATGKRIEIGSRRRNKEANTQDTAFMNELDYHTILKVIDLDTDFIVEQLNDISLSPFDIVTIRKKPGYQEQITVRVQGEVLYPGEYVMESNKDRLSDIIKRAGGLTGSAFISGAVLFRYQDDYNQKNFTDQLNLLNKSNDSTFAILANIDSIRIPTVGIRLQQALDLPGSKMDIFLKSGDILKIPSFLQTVKTVGAVNLAKEIIFKDGMSVKDVIAASGGFASNAQKRSIYVIHANGEMSATKKILFFKKYPKINAGDEIYIPLKSKSKGVSTVDILSVTSGLTGMIAMVLAIINLSK